MQDKKQNISPIKQRILHFIEILGISKRDFYANTGISRGTLESFTGITEDTMAKFIATYPNISIEWLVLGLGPVEKNKPVEPVSEKSDNLLYERMLKEKEKEIAKLNREIGRLQHAVEHLKKGGKLFGFGVEVRTELDE